MHRVIHPPGKSTAEIGRVHAATVQVCLGEDAVHRRVVERELRRLPDLERCAVAGEASDPRRCRTHHARDVRPLEQPGVHHRLVHDAQRALETHHSVRRSLPLARLVLAGVRRVVGRDDVDRTVGEALAHGEDILFRRRGGLTL